MMRDRDELQWLRDRGVQIDHKGRIIVSLPAPEEAQWPAEDREPSIAELMRREVNRRGGSHGRRRRSAPKATSGSDRGTPLRACASRLGRPAIGAEVRVYVHTSVARTTRETLLQRGLTLAQVFNECARELTHGT